MSQKASKLNLSDRPALAYHYTAAVEKLTGESIFIHPKLYPKFAVLEDDLRELGIPPRDYAYGVIKMLTPWAKMYGMRTVPAATFCSDWALNKFVKVFNTHTVQMLPQEVVDHDELLQSELTVARMYIERNLASGTVVRLMDVVDDIKPVLSSKWLDVYEAGDKRPVTEALDILMDEYRVRGVVANYSDIVDCLR